MSYEAKRMAIFAVAVCALAILFALLFLERPSKCVRSHQAVVTVPAKTVRTWTNVPERAEVTTFYPEHTETIEVCDEYQRGK